MALCKGHQGENEISTLSILGTSEIFHFTPLRASLELRYQRKQRNKSRQQMALHNIFLQGVHLYFFSPLWNQRERP